MFHRTDMNSRVFTKQITHSELSSNLKNSGNYPRCRVAVPNEEQQDFLADGLEDLDSVCDDLQLYRTSIFKELEAEILGEGAQLMGLQLIQLELRLGKTPSRSFRPVKSAEILWQFWASSSFGVSLAHDGSWSK
ncbi:hypothetical protein Tco_0913603 [Tanacetum coccineum]